MECAIVVGIYAAAILCVIYGGSTWGEVTASRSWVFILPLYRTLCRCVTLQSFEQEMLHVC